MPKTLKDSETYFAELVGKWIAKPDSLTDDEQKELRKLAFEHFPNQGRIDIAGKSLTRGIFVGFKNPEPILDFLDDKPFKLERAHKRRLFESWSVEPEVAFHFASAVHGRRFHAQPYPMGIVFRHKFKPKEIVLDVASDYIDSDLSNMLNKAMVSYGSSFKDRKYESEILVDSYKANVVALCRNVSKFYIKNKILKEEPDIADSIMERLDNRSIHRVRKLNSWTSSKDDFPGVRVGFTCYGRRLSLFD